MSEGWKCPNCGLAHAPWMATCDREMQTWTTAAAPCDHKWSPYSGGTRCTICGTEYFDRREEREMSEAIDWKDKIEEQLKHMNDPHASYSMKNRFDDAATMQALLDVAVAAEEFDKVIYGGSSKWAAVMGALNKLREMSDE